MRKLLVTGSSGLIGSEVCLHFATRDWQIHGVDNNQRAAFFGSSGDTRWNQKRLERLINNYQHHEVDIRDRPTILELIKTKVTYIVQEAIVIIKDVFRKYPNHYESIIPTLCDSLTSLSEPGSKAAMIWIIGEYAQSQDEVLQAFKSVKRNVGSLPIYQKPKEEEPNAEEDNKEEEKVQAPKVITKTVVLPDGSYGTQTIVVDDEESRKAAAAQAQDECAYLPLRSALVNTEDDYLASCLAVTLTKLTMKAKRNLSLAYK